MIELAVPRPPEFQLRSATVQWNGAEVLRSVDLAVPPSGFVGIVGPSGAGKTTLLRLLLGLEVPSAGSVLVDGADWRKMAPAVRASWRRRIGYVQQVPGLLRTSVLANAVLPLRWRQASRDDVEARARKVLSEVGLAAKFDQPASSLSGGERQRLAMARALIAPPDVLLLDEFTNQQDSENEDRLEAIVIDRHRRGASLVIVSHALSQIQRLAGRTGSDAGIAILLAGNAHLASTRDLAVLARREDALGRFLGRSMGLGTTEVGRA